MSRPLVLASASATRLSLLRAAAVEVTAVPARVDEAVMREALVSESATPRDIADALAAMKARKIGERHPDALVLGCDQVLEFEGQVWGKPESAEDALLQLRRLRGKTHRLHSALVLHEGVNPVWRHVSTASLTLHQLSDAWLQGYVERNWEEIRHSAGAYQIEAEGIRLFSKIEGDYFTVLGLPILPLLTYLALRGFIDT